MMVKLPIGVAFRTSLVRAFARLMRIPIETHERQLKSVIRVEILRYIEEACWIMQHVFEQDERSVEVFETWADQMMMELWDNPFLFHESAYELAADYMGYAYHSHFDPASFAERERLYMVFRQKANADPEFRARFYLAPWDVIAQTDEPEPSSTPQDMTVVH
jgi:hypothetical protein